MSSSVYKTRQTSNASCCVTVFLSIRAWSLICMGIVIYCEDILNLLEEVPSSLLVWLLAPLDTASIDFSSRIWIHAFLNRNWSGIVTCVHFSKTEPGCETIPMNPVTKPTGDFKIRKRLQKVDVYELEISKTLAKTYRAEIGAAAQVRFEHAPRQDTAFFQFFITRMWNTPRRMFTYRSNMKSQSCGKWVPISEWIFCTAWCRTSWLSESDCCGRNVVKKIGNDLRGNAQTDLRVRWYFISRPEIVVTQKWSKLSTTLWFFCYYETRAPVHPVNLQIQLPDKRCRITGFKENVGK